MAITLEVCIDSPEGLAAAVAGGARRVEVCSALALGGLSPSPALIGAALETGLEVAVMVRPRSGDFVWTPAEVEHMRREIAYAQERGAHAVVIGANLPDGRLDACALRRMLGELDPRTDAVLHRAFDLAPDLGEALETAVGLGFDRILTSGGRPRAVEALAPLRGLFDRAAGRIAVMPGGGITPDTVGQLRARLPLTDIHASCARGIAQAARAVAMGFTGPVRRETDAEIVRALGAALA